MSRNEVYITTRTKKYSNAFTSSLSLSLSLARATSSYTVEITREEADNKYP